MMITERSARAKAKRGGWAEWVRSESDLRAVRRGCTFDLAKAQRPVEFFRRFLQHTKDRWAKEPFDPLDWQRDLLMQVFGWRRGDGTRRFAQVFLEVARKNGKTVFAAGVALYVFLADGEASPEVYPVASSRDQAANMYRAAEEMVRANEHLRKRVKRIPSQKRLVNKEHSGFLAVLSPDADTALGVNPSAILFDEIIAQKNRNLWDALRFAGSARSNRLTFITTTAGWDKEGIGGEVYDYACRVRDGVVDDDSFLPVIFEAGPDDDPAAEATWRKANPSLGQTIAVETVREEYNEAATTPRKLAGFRMYRLNMWVAAAHAFIDLAAWDKCSSRQHGESPMEWRERILQQAEDEGWPCWLGMDLGGSRDLTAIVALFKPEPSEDRYVVVPWVFCPEESARPNERPIIGGLIADGFIETTPGNWTDFGIIEERVTDLNERFEVEELAYDRYFAGPVVQRVMEQGIEVTPVRQNAAQLNDPTRELERLVLAGRLDHGGNPVLRWMAGNMSVKQNAGGQVFPIKPKSAAKIDAMTAMITALARAMVADPAPTYQSADDFFVVV